MKKINRPTLSLWARTKYFVLWYVAQFLCSLIVFKCFASLRLVFRALDILMNDSIYKNFNGIALQLILESVLILCLFYFLIRNGVLLYGVYINIQRIKETDKMFLKSGNSFGFEGQQGVGKTRTMVYSSMLLAEARAEDLCLKYYKGLPIRDKLIESERFWELRRFKAQEEAFKFYFIENPQKIACLYGNVDINFNGNTPYKLVAKHFTQQERLYENNVKILTEADDLFPNTLRKKKKKSDNEQDELDVNAIDKFVGLDRQFTNGTLISDTHANGDIFKSIRNCQGFTLSLSRSEYRYTPKILKKIYKKIDAKIIKNGDKYAILDDKEAKTEKELKTMNKLIKRLGVLLKFSKVVSKWMKKISITRTYYRKISGTSENKVIGEEEFFVQANDTPYDYDDRMFQAEYKFTKTLSDTAEAVHSP